MRRRALNQLPLYFVENRGQLDAEVAYTVLGGGTQVYFTRSGVTFAFSSGDVPGAEQGER